MTGSVLDWLQAALAHHRAGRLPEAEAGYRQILALQPSQPDALHLLGVLRGQAGAPAEAAGLIRRAIAASPAPQAGWHSNLGKFLTDAGDFAGAAEACREAAKLKPDFVEAYVNLGNALRLSGDAPGAAAAYREAARLKPAMDAVHGLLGISLRAAGDHAGAVAAFEEALRLRPGDAATLNNLGNALQALGRLDEAEGRYREALRIYPGFAEAHNNLASLLKEQGDVNASVEEYRRAVELRPANAAMHSNLLLALNYQEGSTRESLFAAAREWARIHAEPLGRENRPPDVHHDAGRRLRVGYVTADFRQHASAFFLLPLLENHDRQRVEVFCYSDVARPDDITARCRRAAHQWREIAGLADARVAEIIRADEIDILVDLKLHADQNRLLVFARKPAPVQATWLGYPGTTGLGTMDYRLSDPHLDPDTGDDRLYAEKTVRLPHTFWCYDPLSKTKAGAPPQGRGVAFGSLNHASKVGQGIIAIWSRVLAAAPASTLTLLAHEGRHRQRIAQMFAGHGVQAERVHFVTPRPRGEYLRLYHDIDIGLDTWPVNGHTTTFDSLWMGVPVVTLGGPTALGRAGISQLQNIGLPEWIAASEEDYVRIAAQWAQNRERLAALRAGLRARMEQSPLMLGRDFARAMEDAFMRMWKNHRL